DARYASVSSTGESWRARINRDASVSVRSTGSAFWARARLMPAHATAAAPAAKTSRRVTMSSAARVRADEAGHADHVRLDPLEERPQRQPGREVELAIEREQPEVVVMHAGAFGRHRPAVAGVAEVVFPARVTLHAFRQLGDRGRDVVKHPVHVAVGARADERRVRIVTEHRERLRAFGQMRPGQRRRNVLAFAGMLAGNGSVLQERRAFQLERRQRESHFDTSVKSLTVGRKTMFAQRSRNLYSQGGRQSARERVVYPRADGLILCEDL